MLAVSLAAAKAAAKEAGLPLIPLYRRNQCRDPAHAHDEYHERGGTCR